MISILIPVAAVAGAGLYYGNNHIGISHYKIESSKIPKEFNGFRILQLSDLHSKVFGKENIKLIEYIDRIKPDIIVMTGDMINSFDINMSGFLNLAHRLKDYKVYFIEGNNEMKLPYEKRSALYKDLEGAGIRILDNSLEVLRRGDSSINLYGMTFELKYYKEITSSYDRNTYYSKEDLETVLGNCDENKFNILLTHNPLYFETYVSWGSDLTFAGHVHGGIMRIPGRGGLLSPERKFFPKYSEGCYEKSGKRMIVNRGLGGKILIPRILNCPEIGVVELLSSSNSTIDNE